MAALSDGTKEIVIPQINLTYVRVILQGKTSLLTNQFGPLAVEKMEASQTKAAKGERPPREPESEFRDKLYRVPEEGEEGFVEVDLSRDRFGVPASAIKKCLVTAGGRFADEEMTKLRGILNIMGDILEIKGSRPKLRRDTGKLNGKVGCLIYRPEFTCPWEIEVPLVFNAASIRLEQVLNLFEIAGFAQGIGDWRPEKNGTFGQFCIKKDKNNVAQVFVAE